MVRRTILFCWLSITGFLLAAQSVNRPDPQVDVIHYNFDLILSDSSDLISCTAIINLIFKGSVNSVSFDLDNLSTEGKGMKVSSVLFDGKIADWEHSGNRIRIKTSPLADHGSSAEITLNYSGTPDDGLIISKNKFGNRTFFADHWPDRASCIPSRGRSSVPIRQQSIL